MDEGEGPSGLGTLEPVVEALVADGVLEPAERSWLAAAAEADPGVPPSTEIPWVSWARRAGERANLGAPAAHVALAVAAVCGPAAPGAPDEVARLCVAGRILASSAGQGPSHAWMLLVGGAPGARAPLDPAHRLEAGPGAREAVALWAGLALCGGGDLEAWRRFGASLAEPIQVLRSLARLWLDPAAPDLVDAALTPLLALWLREPELAPALLLACAGERSSPARQAEIHRLVSTAPYRAALTRSAERALAAAREALPGAPAPLAAAGAAFVDALAEPLRFYQGTMAFRDLLALAREEGAPEAGEAALLRAAGADLRAALDYLDEAAPWRGSWESQRFGVLGSAERPVGQWFVRGTILLALLEIGRDVRAPASALLDEIPPGELRYYGAFRALPPDADSLGLMLQLAAATGAARGRAETWIEVMLANVGPDGVVPTWFHRSPRGGSTVDPPGSAWAGDDCHAVRLGLLCGLCSFDPGRFDPLIRANARRALAAAGPDGLRGTYHYDPWYGELALLRFARLARAQAAEGEWVDQLASLELAHHERVLGSQRRDGGWGSPLRTAARLEGLAGAARAPDAAGGALSDRPTYRLALLRALRYLGEHQLSDGSWPAEPLYRIPMKGGREGRHQGRALTTALCARALGAALAALDWTEPGGERRG